MARFGPNFRRLWTASAVSNLADGVYGVTLPLLAVQLTDSPAQVAGVSVATGLPWLLFTLQAGALADRSDRRRLMVRMSAFRAVALAGLAGAVLAGGASLPLVYAVAFAVGCAETVFDTAAQSLLPAVVRRDDLKAANGRLYAIEIGLGELAGPPVGGLLAGLAITLALFGGAAAYVLAALLVIRLTGAFLPQRTTTTRMREDVVEGLRYLWGHRLLRALALLGGATNMLWWAWLSVFVLHAVAPGPMGLNEAGYGLLLAASGIGSVLGASVSERAERRLGPVRVISLSLAGWTLFLIAPVLTTNPVVVGALIAVGSVLGAMWGLVAVSLRQRIVPDAMLGRVTAGNRLLSWGGMPIGAALGGLVAELIGLRPLFALTAAATLSLVIPLRLAVTDAAIAAAESRAGR